MKIIDIRDLTTMEGECVAVLPANEPVAHEYMQRYYRLDDPEAKAYQILAKPCSKDRLVLQRGEASDRHYYIVPKYEFYRVED